MNKLIPYIFFLLITACSNPNPYNCKIDQAVISKNDSILNDEHEKKSYYSFMKRTQEPKLETFSNKAYRLIVYYSFGRDCWIYRIKQTSSGGLLTLKKTYKDGARDTLIVKKITREQWQKIDYVINSNCFWTIPLFDGRHGLDGASYILEAYDREAKNPIGKNYTSAVRWSPEKGTDFRTICDVIQDLDSEVYDD